MARIAGIELPEDKRIDYALTILYGVGWSLSKKILDKAGVDHSKRVKTLTDSDIEKIMESMQGLLIEGDLKRKIREDIARLKEIGSYRGIRHSRNLPVRGQRTRSNARTKRGKRKTVGAFKKEVLAKQKQKEMLGKRE